LHHGFQIQTAHRGQRDAQTAPFQPGDQIAAAQDGADSFGAARKHFGLRRTTMPI
jgi:hypothetical protein